MLLILTLLLIAIASYIFYSLYLRPLQERKYYLKTLRNLGYRVKELPFKVMGAPVYDYLQKNQLEQHDAMYGVKVDCQGYDIIMSNLLNSTHILLINLKLAQQMFSTDRFMLFPKYKFMTNLI